MMVVGKEKILKPNQCFQRDTRFEQIYQLILDYERSNDAIFFQISIPL